MESKNINQFTKICNLIFLITFFRNIKILNQSLKNIKGTTHYCMVSNTENDMTKKTSLLRAVDLLRLE